ncbi:hypothetical protein OGATHE_004469 [Ogataea polymorpha]|uniref:Uncharacterized protein n=1 Tax=Ogataea polymorpha TaxID=460523 RepID=A0A9P8NZQ7_9ASCO|nr:hypothetical protein OGATHE_004469 [Ogataea polymorpha]
MALSASLSVLNSTKANPLADLSNFLGTLTDLRLPNGLNNSKISFLVDSKASWWPSRRCPFIILIAFSACSLVLNSTNPNPILCVLPVCFGSGRVLTTATTKPGKLLKVAVNSFVVVLKFKFFTNTDTVGPDISTSSSLSISMISVVSAFDSVLETVSSSSVEASLVKRFLGPFSRYKIDFPRRLKASLENAALAAGASRNSTMAMVPAGGINSLLSCP